MFHPLSTVEATFTTTLYSQDSEAEGRERGFTYLHQTQLTTITSPHNTPVTTTTKMRTILSPLSPSNEHHHLLQ